MKKIISLSLFCLMFTFGCSNEQEVGESRAWKKRTTRTTVTTTTIETEVPVVQTEPLPKVEEPIKEENPSEKVSVVDDNTKIYTFTHPDRGVTNGSKIDVFLEMPKNVSALGEFTVDIYVKSVDGNTAYLSSTEMIVNYDANNFAVVNFSSDESVDGGWLASGCFGSWNGGNPDPAGVNNSIDDGQFWLSYLSMPPAKSITDKIKIGSIKFKSLQSEDLIFDLSITGYVGNHVHTRTLGGNFDDVTNTVVVKKI